MSQQDNGPHASRGIVEGRDMAPTTADLLAENERLRKALKEISDPLLIEGVGGFGFQRALRLIATMRDIAKDALRSLKG
jgi:hypothetical protein